MNKKRKHSYKKECFVFKIGTYKEIPPSRKYEPTTSIVIPIRVTLIIWNAISGK